MLTTSMLLFGTTSALARTCAVRVLSVVRPVAGQLTRKSCHSTYALGGNKDADNSKPEAKAHRQNGTSQKYLQRMEEVKGEQDRNGPLHILINPGPYLGPGYRRLCHKARELLYQMLTLEVTSSTATAYNAEGTTDDGDAPPIGKNAKNRNWMPFLRLLNDLPFDVPCSEATCKNKATCGGHLWLQASPIRYPVMAPVCGDHNNYLSTPSDVPFKLKVGARLLWLPPHVAWAFDWLLPEVHSDLGSTLLCDILDSVTGGSAANGVHGAVLQGKAIVAAVDTRADVGRSFTVSDYARQHPLLMVYQAVLDSQLSYGPGVVEAAGVRFRHVNELLESWDHFRPLMINARC